MNEGGMTQESVIDTEVGKRDEGGGIMDYDEERRR